MRGTHSFPSSRVWVCGAGFPTSPARSPSPSDRDSALPSADPPRRRDEGSPPKSDGNAARRSLSRLPGQKEAPSKPNLPKGTQPADPIMVRAKAGRAGMRVSSGTLQGLCCPGEIVRFVLRTRCLCLGCWFGHGSLGLMYGGMDAEWKWGPFGIRPCFCYRTLMKCRGISARTMIAQGEERLLGSFLINKIQAHDSHPRDMRTPDLVSWMLYLAAACYHLRILHDG